jgi:RNA polymerase sigma-70 factor (ECF subfamily)
MEAAPLTADALLRHEAFVLRLARSLVRNEASAEDIAQEALLSALEHRPHPSGLRSWLARVTRHRALDHLRGEQRRGERETRAARGEAVESGPSAQERLELEHKVVSAVLALEEPYRSVVIAAYYEGIEPTEIARRRRVAPGTVRSQLSRAVEQLRAKLDREFGDRSAWSAVLIGLVGERAPKGAVTVASTSSAALSWPFVGTCTIAAGTLLWLGVRGLSGTSGADVPTLAAPSMGAALPESDAEPLMAVTTERELVEVQAGSSTASAAGSQQAPSPVAEELHSILERTRLLKVAILERGIEVDPSLRASYAWIEKQPQAGVARLIDRRAAGFDLDLPWMDGGGAYYSFTERVHDYQRRPQIGLQGGMLCAGFYGGADGAVVELPEGAFRELASDPSATPGSLEGKRLEAWSLLRTSRTELLDDPGFRFANALQALGLPGNAGAATGRSYLVRAWSVDEFDVAVAVEVIAQGSDDCTLAWMVLQTWPVDKEQAVRKPRTASVALSDLPEDLVRRSSAELRVELDQLRGQAEELLLRRIPTDLADRIAAAPMAADSGWFRLVERTSPWVELPRVREGGAYYSFATKSSSFDEEPDISLERGCLSVRLGLVGDLGELGLARAMQLGPTWNDQPGIEQALLAIDHFGASGEVVAELQAFRSEIPAELSRGAEAIEGHSYLVRSIAQGHHDLLVVCEVLRVDEFGAWLVWKLVQSWPVPRER